MTKYFSRYHEWVVVEGKKAIIGLTDEAQKELREIVFIDLPEVGERAEKGMEVCVVESTKAATDLCSPLTGKILRVNEYLKDHCIEMQTMKEEDRWIYEIEMEDLSEIETLLSLDQYKKMHSR